MIHTTRKCEAENCTTDLILIWTMTGTNGRQRMAFYCATCHKVYIERVEIVRAEI